MSSQRALSPSEGSQLLGSFPMTLPAANPLSWSLGDRLATDTDTTLLGAWEHDGSQRTVTVYDTTEHTVLLCLRTPVGREKYYSAAKVDVEPELDHLRDADDWHALA